MTETKPATDEEIATIRRTIGPRYDHAFGGTAGEVRALIARIDAERERAEKAEDEAETIGTLSRIARETSAAQLTEAQQQIAALREALFPFAQAANAIFQSDTNIDPLDACTSAMLTVGHLRRANETYYAALAQTEGAEG